MYTRQHPMGRYKKRNWSSGCLMVFVVIGVGVGILLFRDNPLTPAATVPAEQLMSNIATVNAMMENASSSNEVSNLPPADANFASEPKLFLPDVITGSIIQPVSRTEEGWNIAALQNTVGHLEGTAWLGDSGNTVLAAYYEDALDQPDVFYYLAEISIGDQITIEDGSPENRSVYVVIDVFTTTPDDDSALSDTAAPRLTLIASDSWNPNRENPIDPIVVIAEPLQS